MSTPNLPRAALTLASRGLAVFPLKARDKAPATKHGFKDATTDATTVKAWWEGWAEQNIGIATGERSGVFVVDVDGDEGESSLAKLCGKHGPLPATVESLTGKGRHIWFRYPSDASLGSTAKRLGPGLDTRGNDGYVVAPPSVHPSGRRYEWSVDCAEEFADAPDWLVDLLQSAPKANGLNGHAHQAPDVAARLVERLSPDVREMIGKEDASDRSKHCYRVMCRLFEAGLSDFDLIAIADGAPFARKFWERGDLVDEVTRARGRWVRDNLKAKAAPEGSDWRKGIITADVLETRDFPDVSWIVQPIIPEGLTLFAGKPKIGKSWWALDLALGVASGSHIMGGIRPESGDVLYCALEDNQRRLKRRITKILGSDWPAGLTLATQWRRLNQGGVEDLQAWCKSVSRPRLVILDTLAGVRPVKTNNGYTEDYDALADLHRLANELGIAVVVLHHTRKMDAEDPVDQVSGTLGLAGCADTVMVLNRTSSGTTLYGRGRDIEEFERAVEFNKDTCRWRILGDVEEVRRSDTRKAILEALAESDDAMGPKDIAAATDKSEGLIKTTLFRMAKEGEVAKEGRGLYRMRGEAEAT